MMLLITILALFSSPISQGSVDVTYTPKTFLEWDNQDFSSSFLDIQRIARNDLHCGYSSWLTYGDTQEIPFKWHVVPFNGESPDIFKQVQVLWNITFPSGDSQLPLEVFSVSSEQNVNRPASHNAFADREVIERQLIYEGDLIYVLYNYAPLSEHHFLLIPKREALSFLNLTRDEYLEAEEIAQNILKYYSHLRGHLLDKNGKAAGQTVPHWHQHLILTEPGYYEWFTRLQFAARMILGASPLPINQLQEKVASYRAGLGIWLKNRMNH